MKKTVQTQNWSYIRKDSQLPICRAEWALNAPVILVQIWCNTLSNGTFKTPRDNFDFVEQKMLRFSEHFFIISWRTTMIALAGKLWVMIGYAKL